MLARALAQSREDTYSKPSSTFMAFGGNKIYTVYTGPSTSSTVGYSYPEAAAAALILEHLAAYQAPGADWMSTAILGRALADAGLRAEGKALLLKVIAAHPQETYPILALAAVRVQGGDLKEAQAAVQRVLHLNPKNPEALLMEDEIGRALKGRSASLK
jgi:tetratricopeptide (TPR) repeat protein